MSPLPQRPLTCLQEYMQRLLARGFCRTAFLIQLSYSPASFLPLPSTLRSPSSPIHEEDEEKLSEDSDAPLPPSGVELVLRESSSPEVRLASHEALASLPQALLTDPDPSQAL